MQTNYYVDLEIHNKQSEPNYRKYKVEFEPSHFYKIGLSVEAQQTLSVRFDIRFKNIQSPIINDQYLFTTLTPENDQIRYFLVIYQENPQSLPLSMIVQDCINSSGRAGAGIYTLHCLTQYTPLHDLYFKSIDVSLDVCFRMYFQNLHQYTNFESVFTDENFEDCVTQFQLLEY